LKKPAAPIALVLFARSAPEEACHKKLLSQSPATRHQPLFEAFTESSLALLAATGLPYQLISSAQQVGSTFGERLYHALAQTFDQGYGKVIVIGNDCPQLQVRDLHRAAGLLNDHDTVLGPSQNGGIYLLGLSKEAFEKTGCFGQIPWQTPAVKDALTAYFTQQQNTVACLPAYADINTPRDFRRARQQKWFCRSLRNLFNRLLNLAAPQGRYQEFLLVPVQYQAACRFRGPPAFPC
jgi:glycosyltransferase A (GT-A) superfamily protein (DUF2064 family)